MWLPHGFPYTILQFGQFFLLGILLCDAWTIRWRHLSRTVRADVLGLVAALAFVAVNVRFKGLVADVMNPWLIACFFYAALRGQVHGRALSWGVIPTIGGMCYSIYLLHARVIAALVHGVLEKLPLFGVFVLDYAIVLPVCALGVLVVSAAFYLMIEQPCMNPGWPAKAADRLLGTNRRGCSPRAMP